MGVFCEPVERRHGVQGRESRFERAEQGPPRTRRYLNLLPGGSGHGVSPTLSELPSVTGMPTNENAGGVVVSPFTTMECEDIWAKNITKILSRHEERWRPQEGSVARLLTMQRPFDTRVPEQEPDSRISSMAKTTLLETYGCNRRHNLGLAVTETYSDTLKNGDGYQPRSVGIAERSQLQSQGLSSVKKRVEMGNLEQVCRGTNPSSPTKRLVCGGELGPPRVEDH